MKIGDKVRILKSGLVGIILAETQDGWKIDFLNGEPPVFVSKNTPMEVVKETPNPKPEPEPRPKKRMNWKGWLWTIGIGLFIATAIFITLKNVL